jgi:hypothetical protein
MPVSEEYRRQAALLVRALPLVAEETSFALKEGPPSISSSVTCRASRWISI